MESEGLPPCSQKPVTEPYPEPADGGEWSALRPGQEPLEPSG